MTSSESKKTARDRKPPDLEAWCDYLRGVADAETAALCRAYTEGSEGALDAVSWLSRTVAVGKADAETEIPAGARRVVRALGSVHRPPADASATSSATLSAARWRRSPFRVRFDSLVAPATAGVRDASGYDLGPASPRRVVFESDELVVEVRIEEELRHGTVIVGQAVRRDDPSVPASGLPLLVTAAGRVVERTESGELGEFQCERLPGEALGLTVVLDDERVLELPLTGVPESIASDPQTSSPDEDQRGDRVHDTSDDAPEFDREDGGEERG